MTMQYLEETGEVTITDNKGYYVDFWVANYHILNAMLEYC